MPLSSTQIGALAENLVANELMIGSEGRLSAFQPIADDDGIDVLIYDKITGNACPIQIKARTNTLKKRASQERGNVVHFEVRKATFIEDRNTVLLCALLSPDLRHTERVWLIPYSAMVDLTMDTGSKYIIRANKLLNTSDKYKPYQCKDMEEVASRIIGICNVGR
ncbi:MAG: hypothetical protein O2971_16615 [Proteobacteria bacterium]|nr:hypothetical protein [Pseudomonadota bacterium]